MSQSQTRQQVTEYLTLHGPLEDTKGRATAKLMEAVGYVGSDRELRPADLQHGSGRPVDARRQRKADLSHRRSRPTISGRSDKRIAVIQRQRRWTMTRWLPPCWSRLSRTSPRGTGRRERRVMGPTQDRATGTACRRIGTRPHGGQGRVEDHCRRTRPAPATARAQRGEPRASRPSVSPTAKARGWTALEASRCVTNARFAPASGRHREQRPGRAS